VLAGSVVSFQPQIKAIVDFAAFSLKIDGVRCALVRLGPVRNRSGQPEEHMHENDRER
jgi:hypothetical protein